MELTILPTFGMKLVMEKYLRMLTDMGREKNGKLRYIKDILLKKVQGSIGRTMSVARKYEQSRFIPCPATNYRTVTVSTWNVFFVSSCGGAKRAKGNRVGCCRRI